MVTSLLLDDLPCSAPSPCTCLSEHVDCSGHHLTRLPVFSGNSTFTDQSTTLFVYLFNNDITVLPDNGFNALRLTGASMINLYLYNNKINDVKVNAFAGIESLVNELDLQNNRLSTLPTAVGRLSHLKVLNIDGNYLQSLDSGVLQSVGYVLSELRFSANNMQQWPSNLNLLRRITKLQIDDIPFGSLANDSFHGLEYTLSSLTITGSNLASIPTAICRLRALRSFLFGNNKQLKPIVTNTPICPLPMRSVTTVDIYNNDLVDFPDVFNNFPNAVSINVRNNDRLYYVPSESVKANHNLTDLSLYANHLSSIPHAIAKLRNLRKLNLKMNFIRVVDGNTFDDLRQLTTLELQGNPIIYIEGTAFSGLRSLATLDLQNTGLHAIPKAVVSLPALTSLALDGLKLNCTCDIAHREPWPRMLNVSIGGLCSDNVISIQTYVENYLTLC